MPETAAGVGVDPYDPFASIDAAAALAGSYVDAYRDSSDDPYAPALAAYNAGPSPSSAMTACRHTPRRASTSR